MKDRLMAIPTLGDGWGPPLLFSQVGNDGRQRGCFGVQVITNLIHGRMLVP